MYRKKLFFLSIIFAGTLYSCKSTNYLKYYRNMNEAQFYFYQKDYKTARNYYEQGFKKVKTYLDRDLLYYASCLWKTGGDTQKTISILDTNVYCEGKYFARNFFEGMSDSLKNAISIRNSIFSSQKEDRFYSSPLYSLLSSMKVVGQIARKKMKLQPFTHQDSINYDFSCKEIFYIDSINEVKLDSIFASNGFPGGINSSWPSHVNIQILMIHAHYNWLKENQSFLFKELKKGHILPVDYARPIDRIFYESKALNQYYGQYLDKVGSLTSKEYFKHANSIGLSPYFYYQDQFYPIDKLPKTTPFYEYYEAHKAKFNCVR